MKNEKISIVFFGSGPVASASLALLKDTFHIEAVVTKPTTLREMSNIVDGAEVHSVSDKKELDDLFTTENFKSRVGILIDFGIIVNKKIIDYFEEGIVNSHFSILPNLRGADPISFAILNGLEETGVSLMLLVEAMDEGPIISSGVIKLDQNETSTQLTENLVNLSYEMLARDIPKYISISANGDCIVPFSQQEVAKNLNKEFIPTYTRKLTKSDGNIDWNKPALTIHREVRAFIEWPKSKCNFNGIDCIITDTTVVDNPQGHQNGRLFMNEKKLCVACSEGAIQINSIKPANKKNMSSESFLAGYKSRLLF